MDVDQEFARNPSEVPAVFSADYQRLVHTKPREHSSDPGDPCYHWQEKPWLVATHWRRLAGPIKSASVIHVDGHPARRPTGDNAKVETRLPLRHDWWTSALSLVNL